MDAPLDLDLTDSLLATRLLADKLTDHVGYLASHLAAFPDRELCRRLGCTLETAIALQLCRTPRLPTWRRDVGVLARRLDLDVSRLVDLLHAAEALC